jgi:hypothetical protein
MLKDHFYRPDTFLSTHHVAEFPLNYGGCFTPYRIFAFSPQNAKTRKHKGTTKLDFLKM